jgi:hypothetical protein
MKTTRTSHSDIDKCLAGKCMGPVCPCLCHTSLKYDHAALAVRGRRNGKARRDARLGARARTRDASVT